MPLKRRIFLNSTLMVLISLLIMFAVGGMLIEDFKDEYLDGSEGQSMRVDSNAFAVKSMIESEAARVENWEELDRLISQHGYSLHVEDDDDMIYESHGKESHRGWMERIDDELDIEEETGTFFLEGATIVKSMELVRNRVYFLTAIYSENEDLWFGLDRNRFEMFVGIYLAVGAFSIMALLLISQIFTRRMVKRIMTPVNELMMAAGRVEEGDMKTLISYKGEAEFEKVCDSFNQMQQHLKEGIDKNAAYEKARTDMVSGISHDLRTPLTAVKGCIKGLKDGVAATPKKKEQYLEIAYRKTCDIDALLERLFYFSKLETGSMPVFFKEEDLDKFLKNLVSTLKRDYEHVSLRYSGPDEPTTAAIDREQLKRVIANIIENSVKYADTDAPSIGISLQETEGKAVIQVSDDGPGVPEEKLSRIFQQFYRGDESRNTKKEGSGLGLYIAKYIVEAHGGEIKAENAQGLIIKIFLPLKNEKEKIYAEK